MLKRFIAVFVFIGLLQVSVESAERPTLKLARLKWTQSEEEYNPRPSALARLSYELSRRTSAEVDVQTADVEPKERELFEFPLIFMSAGAENNELSEDNLNNIKTYLVSGGLLVIDSATGASDKSIRKLIKTMFPKNPLKRIKNNHVLYKTFYLLPAPYGRKSSPAFVEGVFIDKRLAILYSQLDMQGAWARDAFGNWEYAMEQEAGDERELAVRFGINIIMYALCFDYKNDAVHLPFILKRRR